MLQSISELVPPSPECFFTMTTFSASITCTLAKWPKHKSLSRKMGTSWSCVRKRKAKGKRRNEVSCQKSSVQRAIWETGLLYGDRVSLRHHCNTDALTTLPLTYHHCIKVHWLSPSKVHKNIYSLRFFLIRLCLVKMIELSNHRK